MMCIQEQDYKGYEHIVIDGGSKDGTLKVLEESYERGEIKVVYTESDKSVYEAWNKGIGIAKGKWVIFIGCDDYICDRSILSQFAMHEKELGNEIEFICSKVVDDAGKRLGCNRESFIRRQRQRSMIDKWLGRKFLPANPGIFYRRSQFKDKRFREDMKICSDLMYLSLFCKESNSTWWNVLTVCHSRGGISTDLDNAHYHQVERDNMLRELGEDQLRVIYWVRRAKIEVFRILVGYYGKATKQKRH